MKSISEIVQSGPKLGDTTRCSLVSQARPTPAKMVKTLISYIYKLCPSTQCSRVQSHCSTLPHDTLHHCLRSNNDPETGNREPGELFYYCRSSKNTFTMLLEEHVHRYSCYILHLANCIPVGHSMYTQFTRLSLFWQNWVWLVRLGVAAR